MPDACRYEMILYKIEEAREMRIYHSVRPLLRWEKYGGFRRYVPADLNSQRGEIQKSMQT
jgi:hypothetical protein